jgi:hypothetical protein
MTIEILHAEPFRFSGTTLPTRYAAPVWGTTVNALVWDGASLGRAQTGRGVSPQGWSIYGAGAPNQSDVGIRTVDMFTPRVEQPGNFVECFAFTRGGQGAACPLAQYGNESGTLLHLELTIDATGHIVATNGDGDVLGTSGYAMPLTGFYALQIAPYLHTGAGWVMVKVDGELVLDLSGKKTSKGMASPTLGVVNHFLLGGRRLADWVIHDGGSHGATKAAVEWLPDVRAALLAPSVAGTYVAGTAVGAASKLLAVNDLEHTADQNPAWSDDDTRVDFDDTSLPKAVSFTTAALPADARTVYAVIPFAIVKKTDAGANTARLLLISGADETDGGADLSPQTGYRAEGRVEMTDPADGDPWSDDVDGGVAAADAAEIGIRRTA